MSSLPVNEIFDTVQGEAHWTGTPSTFVRLQGCAVGCPWCDTKHTWPLRAEMLKTQQEILQKQGDSETYAVMNHFQIARQCSQRHVVITGGEPCDHDLTDLTDWLIEASHSVQIETSGTAKIRANPKTWVTVSPKINMPGGKLVLSSALERADEIKMPVGKLADIMLLTSLLDGKYQERVWLQPLSMSPKATALCVKAASEHGFRVSIQTHKLLGVR